MKNRIRTMGALMLALAVVAGFGRTGRCDDANQAASSPTSANAREQLDQVAGQADVPQFPTPTVSASEVQTPGLAAAASALTIGPATLSGDGTSITFNLQGRPYIAKLISPASGQDGNIGGYFVNTGSKDVPILGGDLSVTSNTLPPGGALRYYDNATQAPTTVNGETYVSVEYLADANSEIGDFWVKVSDLTRVPLAE